MFEAKFENSRHTKMNLNTDTQKTKTPRFNMTATYLVLGGNKSPGIKAVSGRKRQVRNTMQTISNQAIIRCRRETSLGRYLVFCVFCTSALSFADASSVTEAITKPNNIPATVATVDAIGCI